MKKLFIFSFGFFGILFLNSCSNTRFLQDDQVLYTGRTKVHVISKQKGKELAAARELADHITFIRANNALLGTRRVWLPIGLWTYNYRKPKKEGKKGGWLYRNLKKDPILISTVNPELRCKQIESMMFGIGFFDTKASYKLHYKKNNLKKAKIEYTVQLDTAFRIQKIVNPVAVDSIDMLINAFTENLKIKPGDVFNLEEMKAEKQKMVTQLNELGYYYFGTANIDFIADTSEGNHMINLMIRKNNETPEYIFKKYRIGNIKIKLTGVPFKSDSITASQHDTIYENGIEITGLHNYLKPEVLTRCVQFTKGDYYSSAKHQNTIKQINNYGIFKYIKLEFLLVDTTLQQLDLTIYLSPKNDVSVNLEGFVQNKSTGFTGPGMEVTISHGNVGRAANKLNLKFTGGFEWQWGKKSQNELGTYSYNAGVNGSFVFPQLKLPVNIGGREKLLSSKTICEVGFEFLNNVRYYTMTSVTAAYSYQWKKRPRITNKFSPLKVNIVNLLETTKEFDDIVAENIYVKKSFEEQTILGMEYGFLFDNTSRLRNGTYFQAIAGTSGNFIYTLNNMGGGEGPYTILGNVYSQFIKLSADFRYYTSGIKKGLVLRWYAGTGISYGNSTVMPYIEQFYSGGSTSIRGFSARSLGPGSYQPVESNGIIDQTGDIKLEANAEYRYPITDLIKGALFLDAGNVWLLNEDENRPGAKFDLSTFQRQVAMAAGFGLRFDFDFFVLRTDIGLPMRNPYKTEDSYWLKSFNDVLDGYRFNLAIGYPF